ncbi:MAG: DUF3737 family protein [Clostridiales bacterium]|nr:DUF3737 family protein [Clostridiales bacterium]
MSNIISGKTYDEERALYALDGATVDGCTFSGPADGESALKESRNVDVKNCKFELRYPLWHSHNFKLSDSSMSETCRAPLWYSCDGKISGMKITGVKCLRECDRIELVKSSAVSPEFGWRCRDIKIDDCDFESEYIFFESSNIDVHDLRLKGKYSFQYTKNVTIADSDFNTKDSFWHAENVRIENSTIRGEYFGWYSDGLTLVNCKIIGTQPFCYCKNLRLENCTLEECDLAFEYSDVEADVKSHIVSVKNPKSGHIVADSIGEIIRGNNVYPCDCEIVIRANA